MNNEQNKRNIMIMFYMTIVVVIILSIFINSFSKTIVNQIQDNIKNTDNTLNIISSSENQDLEDIVKNYANSKGYNVNIDYAGTLDIIQSLNNGQKYDAVWLSNSIWMYMLDSSVKTTNSKCTSINPVVFGITKSKAESLGFVGKTIYTKDILNAISTGNLKFSMSNPTTTNSGASAYLGLLSTLAGNPEVLTNEMLEDETLKTEIKTLFTGLERSSGSEDFLEELILNGDYLLLYGLYYLQY